MNAGPMILRFTIQRFRWLFLITAGYLVVLAVVGQQSVTTVPAWAAGLLVVPFLCVLCGSVFSFVNFEADFASTSSAYHPYLLRLPVRTSVLVLWPTLAAAIWGFSMWIALYALCFHPRGIDMPMLWPAAMFSALAVCFQSILWIPVRVGGARLVAALLIPVSVVLFGMLASGFGWHDQKIALVYGCIWVASLGFAWYGVDRARTSAPGRATQASDAEATLVDNPNRKVKPAFESPSHAQFWLEWRRQGQILPIATAVILGLFTIPILFNRELVEENAFGQAFLVNVYVWPMLPILPWIPLLTASAIGLGTKRSEIRGTDGVYHLYHATRPLAEEDIYRARIKAITAGTLLTIVVTLGFLLLWLSQPAEWNNHGLPFWAALCQAMSRQDAISFGVLTVIVGAWMWRNQVVGAFVDYLPSRFLALMYPLVVTVVGVGWFVVSSMTSQYLQSDQGRIALSIVLGAVLTAKLAVAALFGARLVRLRETSIEIIALSLAKWVLAAGISAATLYWIAARFDDGYQQPPYYLRMPVPILVGLIIVPMARPMIARWALQTGRHR